MIRWLGTCVFSPIALRRIFIGLGILLVGAVSASAQEPVREVDRTTAEYLYGRYGCSFIVPKSS